MEFTQSDSWKAMYPEAAVGVLVLKNVSNPKSSEPLEEQKAALEAELREQYAGFDRPALRALPSIQPYHAYYKRFKKTYHVQHQLESVALKGRSLPKAAALVEAMFMAELKNKMLTAGHDLAVVQTPVGVTVAEGGERYTSITGRDLITKRGDMMIVDAEGIISSIIYGPDNRTCITEKTEQALFTVYAPKGIAKEALLAHLHDIESYARVVSPEAEVVSLEVYGG